MTSTGSRPVPADRHGSTRTGRDGDRIVVSIRGEHDISTASALAEDLAKAAALDDSDLVVDLSEVQFMDASTIGVIAQTRNSLLGRSRMLALRAPARHTRRILEVCGMAEFIDSGQQRSEAAGALGSWVAVPASERSDDHADGSVPVRGESTATPGRDETAGEGARVSSARRGS